jgi:hypothetical protein
VVGVRCGDILLSEARSGDKTWEEDMYRRTLTCARLGVKRDRRGTPNFTVKSAQLHASRAGDKEVTTSPNTLFHSSTIHFSLNLLHLNGMVNV